MELDPQISPHTLLIVSSRHALAFDNLLKSWEDDFTAERAANLLPSEEPEGEGPASKRVHQWNLQFQYQLTVNSLEEGMLLLRYQEPPGPFVSH